MGIVPLLKTLGHVVEFWDLVFDFVFMKFFLFRKQLELVDRNWKEPFCRYVQAPLNITRAMPRMSEQARERARYCGEALLDTLPELPKNMR
jgi:hypothetical protein